MIGRERCSNLRCEDQFYRSDRGRPVAHAPVIKRIRFELGDNAPFIVFDDAEIDAAVDGAIQAKFRNAGQTCISAKRIYVQSRVYTEFAERFTERLRLLKVGD
ncbi:hypothetical protein GCM10007919_44910 [Rhizobium indigoferae]|nr:aldehyde dehydrogenase family protein [Rhizobium indigoferae]GLR59764.1 hypothetical protein GCM10007919_44910 [Rhizobium indigoferae]